MTSNPESIPGQKSARKKVYRIELENAQQKINGFAGCTQLLLHPKAIKPLLFIAGVLGCLPGYPKGRGILYLASLPCF
jgi:hypothetical protein